jgi:hypothetical protein
MRIATLSWGATALAACFSAWLGGTSALAQDMPPGCVASGNPNGAAAGALVGGVAGALFGNAVSGKHNKAPGTILGGVTGALAGAAIGNSAGQGSPCPQGYVYRAAPRPQPVELESDQPLPPGASEGDVWYGAPPRIHERIIFLRRRVQMLDHDGWLSPRESEGLFHRLGEIDHREEAIRNRNDGVLPPEVRDHLNDDLNEVARHLRWKEYQTEHASQ